MRKNLLLLCFAMGVAPAVFGQVVVDPDGEIASHNEPKKFEKQVPFTGLEELQGEILPSRFEQYYNDAEAANLRSPGLETRLGVTYYDLQSNGVPCTRLEATADCDIKAVWTGSANANGAPGFSDRGTFYNRMQGCDAAPEIDPDATGTTRVEPNTRTGWGNIHTIADGSNVVLAHGASGGVLRIIMTKQNADGSWTESVVPSDIPTGVLWPHSAVAGNSIHLLAIDDPDAGNNLYYYRSQDGGETWDIVDLILPDFQGLEVSADDYMIEADENGNVAIGLFQYVSDVLLLKSTDNGDTWTKRTVLDFPFPSGTYFDTVYTIDALGDHALSEYGPMGMYPGFSDWEPNAVDSLAVEYCDNTGAITLDANGKAHVSYSTLFVSRDSTFEADYARAYVTTNNLVYWNEDMADDERHRIQEAKNGLGLGNPDFGPNFEVNTVADLASYSSFSADSLLIGNFSLGLMSRSTIAVTESGKVVIAYRQPISNLVERAPLDPEAEPNTYYSHIVAVVHDGSTWSNARDLTTNDRLLAAVFSGQDIASKTAANFPVLRSVSGENIALLFQYDEVPGLNLRENHSVTANTISEFTFEATEGDGFVWDSNVATEEVVDAAAFAMTLAPNPASTDVKLGFELPEAADVTIEVTTITGQKVMVNALGRVAAGTQVQDLNTNDLANGIYMVSIRTNDAIATQRLVINK